jgi:xanthine dehydrogenase molybdopterin-binding subunit B
MVWGLKLVERVLLNLDNAYNLKNIDLESFVCKTNIPSNTVFRGTGAPQAAFLIENIMDVIATTLNKDPVDVIIAYHCNRYDTRNSYVGASR